MTCLTEARIQAVADREGTAEEHEHVLSCPRCAARVQERATMTARLENVVGHAAAMPPSVARRIEASLHQSGATRLRTPAGMPTGRRAAWGGVALAFATIALIVLVPLFMKDRGAVTAAEVLAESAERLASPARSGIEILEYELVVEGMPKDLVPEHAAGTYRIWKAIDHDSRGRYRFSSYTPDGAIFTSIAQDPARGVRTILVTLDGQPYRFEFTIGPEASLALPELERLHMQASIGMMQASGNQRLEVIDAPRGRQYRIEVPRVATSGGRSPLWDLEEARVVVDEEYLVNEFAVKGTFLQQPYSISYRLNNRVVSQSAEPGLFEVPSQPHELVFSGEGTMAAPRDALVLVLRELARLKQDGR